MAFYIQEADRSANSGVANEDIDVGELVKHTTNGAELFDAQDAVEDWSGVADNPYSSDAIAKDEDDNSYGTYLSSENDFVVFGGDENDAEIKAKTVEETNSGVTTAPNITTHDVVGVVDTSDADAPDSKGRLVEEGYSNDENDDASSTTFNRSNNNFIAIGKYRGEDDVTSFDQVVSDVEVEVSA